MSDNGMFDKEEWSFECKRDEKAAKELEEIQAIRDKWQAWVYYRKTDEFLYYGESVQEFADAEAEAEIAKLKEKWEQSK